MIDHAQLDQLRYPVGKFKKPEVVDADRRAQWIATIEALPGKLRDAVQNLTPEQLETPYRPGGWTVRQLVHHIADSHMNAYIRFKLALTENNPTIKPYEEALWAELPDSKEPIEYSLQIVDAVHHRWVRILKAMSVEDFQKTYHHPDQQSDVSLSNALGMYDWHSRHHLAHITELAKRGF